MDGRVDDRHGGPAPEGPGGEASASAGDGAAARATPSTSPAADARMDAVTRDVGQAPDEVTLADLVDAVGRRRRVALAVAGLVLVATIGYTVLQTPVFEATASTVPVTEEAALVDLLQSRQYRDAVAAEMGLDPAAIDVEVTIPPGERKSQATLITITARSTDPQQAARIADAYVAGIDRNDAPLDQIVRDRNWESYFEDAGKNTTRAQQDIDALLAGMSYHEPMEAATVPTEQSSPQVRLNLALGTVLAVMLGLFAVFAAEAGARVRADLRARDGSSK